MSRMSHCYWMKQKHRLQTRGGRLRTDRSPGGADDDKLTSHRTKRVKSESVDWFKQSVHSLNRHHAWTQTGSNNTSNHYSIKLSTKVDVWVKKTQKKPGRFRLSVCQQMVGHKAERKQQRYFIFWIPQQWLDQTSEKWKGWWVIRLVLI